MKNKGRRKSYFVSSLMLALMLLIGCSPTNKSGKKRKINKDAIPIWNPKVSKAEKAKLEISFKTFCPVAGNKVVTDILKPIRQEFKLPAVAAAIVDIRGIVAVGAVGVRKEGTNIPVTLNDRWMIASCTKAMTATIAAKLIEQGKLKWDTTITEVFPKQSSKFNPEFNKITITQLLSQHSVKLRNLRWCYCFIQNIS